MSLPSIMGMDAQFAAQMLIDLSGMVVTFQRHPRTGVDSEDYPTYSDWVDVVRTLPDGTTSTQTPCYFQAAAADPGEVVAVDADYEVNRYTLITPYAPDIESGPDFRVRHVAHQPSATRVYPLADKNPPYRLKIVEVDHVFPVLSTFTLEEVR